MQLICIAGRESRLVGTGFLDRIITTPNHTMIAIFNTFSTSTNFQTSGFLCSSSFFCFLCLYPPFIREASVSFGALLVQRRRDHMSAECRQPHHQHTPKFTLVWLESGSCKEQKKNFKTTSPCLEWLPDLSDFLKALSLQSASLT